MRAEEKGFAESASGTNCASHSLHQKKVRLQHFSVTTEENHDMIMNNNRRIARREIYVSRKGIIELADKE